MCVCTLRQFLKASPSADGRDVIYEWPLTRAHGRNLRDTDVGRTPGAAPCPPRSHAALTVVLEQGRLGGDPERRHRLQRRRPAAAATAAALERGGRLRRCVRMLQWEKLLESHSVGYS